MFRRYNPQKMLIQALKKSQELFVKLTQTLNDSSAIDNLNKSISDIEELIVYIETLSNQEMQKLLEDITSSKRNEDKTFFQERKNQLEQFIDKRTILEQLVYSIQNTYLHAIKIKNYFSIIDMEIEDLKGKKEIYFVGENGDGKTILLQAIALALKGDKYSIFAEDYIKDIKDREKDPMELSTKDSKYPNEYRKYKNVENLFAYGISRNKYDSESEVDGYSGIFETPLISIKLRRPHDLLRVESDLIDNEFIPKIQNLMSDKFKIIKEKGEVYFQEVDAKTIPFKMLSEGYKSTLIWLCDLLSRLIENQPEIQKLEDFKAIVLIDEVDLYLHPKWKYDFMNKLRKIFPKIQFIMTTHSLVTVLGASKDAVFYKVYKEDGETKVSKQIDDISYYTSNILLTSPLFSLDSMKARSFKKDEPLSSDDYIYREIHTSVREYMRENPSLLDDELKQKVKDELKKRLARLRKK